MIQDFPFLWPRTISGIINIDGSFGSKEKDEKSIGPVPLPCTLFWIKNSDNCSFHQFLAFKNLSSPFTSNLLYSPNPTKPSPLLTHAVTKSKFVFAEVNNG